MRRTQHHQEEARDKADIRRTPDGLEGGAHRIGGGRNRPANRAVGGILAHHHRGKDERRSNRVGSCRGVDALASAQLMVGCSKARGERRQRRILDADFARARAGGLQPPLNDVPAADERNFGNAGAHGAQGPLDDARVFSFGKHDMARRGFRGFENAVERFHQACPR
ncbi:hypothetical protein FQZ97_945110 [compost metagenome]